MTALVRAALIVPALAAGLCLTGCERRWKGDHIEPLKPMADSGWREKAAADASAETSRRQRAIAAAPDCDAALVRFEPAGKLSAEEGAMLAAEHAGPQLKLKSGATGAIVYRQFDYDAFPQRFGLDGVAQIVVRTTDGRTAQGLVWSAGGPGTPNDIGHFEAGPDGVALKLELIPDLLPGETPKCVRRFTVQMGEDGVVRAGGTIFAMLGDQTRLSGAAR